MDIPLNDEVMARRFWSYVDTITGQWTGYHDADGYGIFTITGTNGRRVKLRAHRVAWALTHQTPPTGAMIMTLKSDMPVPSRLRIRYMSTPEFHRSIRLRQ